MDLKKLNKIQDSYDPYKTLSKRCWDPVNNSSFRLLYLTSEGPQIVWEKSLRSIRPLIARVDVNGNIRCNDTRLAKCIEEVYGTEIHGDPYEEMESIYHKLCKKFDYRNKGDYEPSIQMSDSRKIKDEMIRYDQ